MRTLKTPMMFRAVEVTEHPDGTHLEVAFSSEEPVERWFGTEILDHGPKSVRLDRLRNGGPMLVNHDTDDQVGVWERASIDGDRRGRARGRFGRSARAQEIGADVRDGIRQHVSVGYRVHRMVADKSRSDGEDVFRVVDWEPFEISIVPTPADMTVGVGRGMDDRAEFETLIEDAIMTDEKKTTDEKRSADDGKRKDIVIEMPDPGAEKKGVIRGEAGERARVTQITAVARQYGGQYPRVRELADQAVLEEWTYDRFRDSIIPSLASAPRPNKDSPLSSLGMSDKDAQSYSLLRMIKAVVRSKLEGGDPARDAPFEMECSRTIADRMSTEPRGFLVPHDVQQRTSWLMPRPPGQMIRAVPLDTTENVHLVSTDHLASSFIDALRARTAIMQAGATVLDGLVGDQSIPKLTSSATFGWVAEDVDSTDSEPGTASVTLTPKTLTASVPITRRLTLQSSPAVEQMIRNDLVQGAAITLDDGAINGDAAGPTGILAETGVQTVSIASFATTGFPTWAEAVEFETAVDTALGWGSGSTYITTPAVSGSMKTTAKDAGSGLFIQAGGEVNGYPVLRTTLMAAKTIVYGDYSQMLVGMWGMLDINVDVATKAASGGIVLRAFQDADVAVRHGESFAKSTA